MNWFQKWFFRWSFIDLPTLGAGLLLMTWYLKTKSATGIETALVDSIGPNLATELFGVWLSVRIIESILRSRQKRSHLRTQLVDNMKYLVTLIRSIAPHFDQQTIDRLSSELMWFEEMKSYRIKGISAITLKLIDRVIELYANAAEEALKIIPLREEINDLFLKYPEMLDDPQMRELHDVYRRQNYTRIIVDRIDSRIAGYKKGAEPSAQTAQKHPETEVIRKFDAYSGILKTYISITLDAEAAVMDARSAVLNREYNY